MLDNFDSIVHGVDVSGCKFAEPGYKTPKCSIEGNLHCDGFRNCYYKQYKRTEKALKETYLACYKTKHEELADKYEALNAELDKIKTTCDNHFDEYEMGCLSLSNAIESLLERYDNAITDLMQYKKSKQASYEAMQKEWNDVELENRKLKQTLTEIKEIAETKQKQSVFIGETVFEQILQKISEVIKDENNNYN